MSYKYMRLVAREGVFDACADSAMVLAMPGRLRRAVKQVEWDRPHRHTVVQLNMGMGGKGLHEATTRADICHAYAAAFAYALRAGWGRVLILEDDFFFDGSVAGARRVARAAPAISALTADPASFHTYNLGRVVFVGWPAAGGGGHWRAVCHASAHAVIYSSRYMLAYLEQFAADPEPITVRGNDLWWNQWGMTHYVWRHPLVFQTFPPTANQKIWGNPFYNLNTRLLGLHASHVPGYAVLNLASKAPFFVSVAAVTLAVMFFVSKKVSAV